MKNIDIKESWVDAAQYVAATLCAFVFLRDVFGAFSFKALLYGVTATAVLVPWPYRQLGKLTRFAPGLWFGWIAAFFLLMLSGEATNDALKKKQAITETKQANESAQRIAKARADREVEWSTSRQQVLDQVDDALGAGKINEAFTLASKFITVSKDPDLARRYNTANILLIKKDLERENELPFDRKMHIYAVLSSEEPNNANYTLKYAELKELVAIKQKMAASQIRRGNIEAAAGGQFSKFDGSHRKVEDAIKSRMKNPSSYEHVKTGYTANPDSITVHVTYRGTNSFGAIVTNHAVAEVDAAGTVQTLMTQ